MSEGKRDIRVYGASGDTCDRLAVYARVHGMTMAEAFDRAIESLVSGLDGAERQLFDKQLAEGVRRRGPKPASKAEPAPADGGEA
jgi:hypothetical protein